MLMHAFVVGVHLCVQCLCTYVPVYVCVCVLCVCVCVCELCLRACVCEKFVRVSMRVYRCVKCASVCS